MVNKFTILILSALMFVVTGINSGSAEESKIYDLSLIYDKGNITLKSEIAVRNGFAPGRKIQPEAGYKAEVISLKDEVLHSFKFQIVNKTCTDSINPVTKELSGACELVDKTNFALIIPYFENGKVINIYDSEGNKVFFAIVEHLAKTCGDSVCQQFETETICPQDCSPKVEKPGVSIQVIVGAAVAVLAVIIAAKVISKKRKNGNTEQ